MARPIVITNAVAQNGGDAAILYATMAAAKAAFPDHTISLVEDADPVAVSQLYAGIEFGPYIASTASGRTSKAGKFAKLWAMGVEHILAVAFLVSPRLMGPMFHKAVVKNTGSQEPGVCISSGGTYIIEKYYYLDKLLNLAIYQSCGYKTILATQSLGPFRGGITHLLLKKIFSTASLILLRDEKSLNHAKEAGLDTSKCKVVSDIVFNSGKIELWGRTLDPGTSPTNIGISVRDCTQFQKESKDETVYRQNVATLCKQLIDDYNCNITFISTCQGLDTYKYDDAAVAREIVSSLPEKYTNRININSEFHDPRQFEEEVSKFDLVVSTRLHGAIQSLNVGTPVIPVAYEFKTNEVWTSFGERDSVLPLYTTSYDAWGKVVKRIMTNYNAYANKVHAGVSNAQKSASDAVKHMKNITI